MEIVLGILLLLALCGSRAAKQGLTLLIGVPLGLLGAICLLGLLTAGFNALTASAPSPRTTPAIQAPPVAAPPQSAAAQEIDDAYVAGVRLYELRKRYGTLALP